MRHADSGKPREKQVSWLVPLDRAPHSPPHTHPVPCFCTFDKKGRRGVGKKTKRKDIVNGEREKNECDAMWAG